MFHVVSFTSTVGFDFLYRTLPHVQPVTPDPLAIWNKSPQWSRATSQPCSSNSCIPVKWWVSVTHTVSSASHRPLRNSCPVGRSGVFQGPGQPRDPLVLSDCISCNVGKRLEPTISLCSRRCLRAGSNKSHKPPIWACCTPAGRLQTAAGTFPTSLRAENLTNVTYVHLKTAWMKLFGLLVFHSFLFSFQNELLVFKMSCLFIIMRFNEIVDLKLQQIFAAECRTPVPQIARCWPYEV